GRLPVRIEVGRIDEESERMTDGALDAVRRIALLHEVHMLREVAVESRERRADVRDGLPRRDDIADADGRRPRAHAPCRDVVEGIVLVVATPDLDPDADRAVVGGDTCNPDVVDDPAARGDDFVAELPGRRGFVEVEA